MKEVEVKAKIEDFEEIKKKLTDLGCDFSQELIQKDTIYLHSSMEFKDISRGKVILRIRDTNGEITFNLKKQLNNELDNIEREVVVSDKKQMADILEYLDYKSNVQVSKKRITCKLKDLTICLDDVETLGTFIEVEKMTEDEDSVKVQEELFTFLESLGVKKDDQVFKGYDTMIYELE